MTEEKTAGKGKLIGYWVVTAIFCLPMLGGGVMDILQPAEVVSIMENLGYPLYFATALGVGKLIGVPILLAPGLKRAKEWVYAAYGIDLVMAMVSHMAVGDPITDSIPPVVILGLAIASHQLRPESRKLVS